MVGLVDNILRQADKTPRPACPASAARNAFDTTSAIASGELTSTAYLVTGLNMATVSMLWCTSFALSARFTAPPSATTGSPSLLAVAMPVIRLEQPGPEVTNATRPYRLALPYRCHHKRRVRLVTHRDNLDGGVQQGVKDLVDFAPGMPNTCFTPCASSWPTTISAPCAHRRDCFSLFTVVLLLVFDGADSRIKVAGVQVGL